MSATGNDAAAAAAPPRGVRTVAVEVATALLLGGLGAAAIWDSRRLGAGWGAEGPQSGYFPFWIGLVLAAASLGNLALALRAARRGVKGGGGLFVTWPQLRLVLSVLLPTAIYVAAIPFTGLYLASALLVAWFMMRLGGFRWWSAAPAGLATALVAFVVFETWFLVALPKGPIETWLGY
ncbi:MAG: Tripartite tricarboxylate transporter TctB family [uncultured Acetobacteraceae bacterium]|uniref:Tripartite tricarboxylate transporter TctB family n=1 Tax=uncultured Acetobacteraceae bacterium TaxID=169975 RepID=A0A6J4HP63_9PROT|nr:MAG: Tripartite tricarboxylate transporter TctB family [uncultured Acetobacteraceae bacterium]